MPRTIDGDRMIPVVGVTRDPYSHAVPASPPTPRPPVLPSWVPTACAALLEPDGPTTVAALAQGVGLSPAHVQRTFTAAVGVSPRQFAAAGRSERLRRELVAGDPVLEVIFAAGFASASVAYEEAPSRLGMTPGRFARGGEGEKIAYTVVSSDLGDVLIAATERGLVAVRIGDGTALFEELREGLSRATFVRDDALLAPETRMILGLISGEVADIDLPLDIAATAFQARVWASLRAVPAGSTATYAEVAAAIGSPRAVRAVASACAANPVALVIPCHRVIRSDGSLSGYRWGIERKAGLLERERGRTVGAVGS